MSILKVDELQSRTSGNRITLPDVNNYPPYRNLIINGDMSIAQRGTSFSLTSGNNKFPVDRFKVFTEGSYAYTVSQSTDVPTGQGFTNSIKVDVTTGNASPSAGDQSLLYYNVEGLHLQHLKKGTSNAESVTLSFWVKSTATGNMQVNLRDLDNARIIGNTITVNSANTWEKKTLTFAGDTTGVFGNDNGASLRVTWMLGSGSTYTSGAVPTSWEAFSNGDKNAGDTMNFSSSASNDLYITGVQLEVGDSATPFEHLPYDVNLQRCQRYFQNFGGTAPFERVSNGFVFSSTGALFIIPRFSCPMRSAPSLSVSSVSNFLVSEPSGSPSSYVCTVIVINNAGLNSTSIETTVASGLTTNRPCILGANSTLNARLNLDAEL